MNGGMAECLDSNQDTAADMLWYYEEKNYAYHYEAIMEHLDEMACLRREYRGISISPTKQNAKRHHRLVRRMMPCDLFRQS